MGHTLIGSHTSPYVRKLRLVMHNRVAYEFKTINYLEENDALFLNKINPINKIPVFLDGEDPIYDSRVIYNYLVSKYQWKPLTLKEENYLSAIDGAMDTAINLFSLKRGGLDLDTPNTYLTRQKDRIPQILDYLKPWVIKLRPENAADWNFASMSLYSFLYWANFREVIAIDLYPEMKKFLFDFKNNPGVQETTIIV